MFQRLSNEKYYRKFYFQDSFHAQCEDIDPLTMIQFDRSAEQVGKIITQPIFRKTRHIIGCGCGDSNIAAFAVKEAFAHYLPDVTYEAVEAIELSRHYNYGDLEPDTVALFISVSGEVLRTIEAMEQCKRHHVTTVAVTGTAASRMAKEADILYYENPPEGDNNAGLRTYYMNVISAIILAAAIGESREGKSYLRELRGQVKKYHDAFFSEFKKIDDACFAAAINWMDKKYLEVCADGPWFWSGKFIRAKIIELSGDACSCIDSENYKHVNGIMYPGSAIGEIVIINSRDLNVPYIAESVNAMVNRGGRDVLLFCDEEPGKIGINVPVRYCRVPWPDQEWSFLAPIYAYLPGALFGGFRHTTIGEPMFRGGFDPAVFVPAYFSPIDVVEL